MQKQMEKKLQDSNTFRTTFAKYYWLSCLHCFFFLSLAGSQ